ncbi:unnamed protein product [Prunus brigantina]
MQEQAVVEDLMNKQASRIETSFMAAMDRFSSELRTLFQERMSVTSSATPPGAGQRSQERESSSLGASARTQASGYDQHSQPPTNSWGQSQPTWVNPGPTRPVEMAYGPLHAFCSPASRPSSHLGRPDLSWPKQRARCFITAIRSEQSDRFTITDVVIFARLSPSLRSGHSDGSTHASWLNPWRLSSAARLDRNGRTPRSSGPTDKAAE